MRDAYGSIIVLAMIIVFIVVVSGYMAFNVNYTKAFRMKNKIIDVLEDYDGVCQNECETKIFEYAEEIGYDAYHPLVCEPLESSSDPESEFYSSKTQITAVNDQYCLYRINAYNECSASDIASGSCANDMGQQYYYRVKTVINIRVPIIQRVLGFNLLTVTGDTKKFNDYIDEEENTTSVSDNP